ncbi:MAG: hypothetical protein DWQ01_18690 [Planctomycetota bacterium]|nr:MAG: hypothetical protein DWQ01_18690 [Planctomycetota bacterium]
MLKADEIVLTFDECLASVSDLVEAKRLPLDVKKKIQEIDKLFERMTQEGGDHWTEDAVRSNREWKEARELAGEILERMKVPMDRPRLDWVTYVLESKDPSPPRNIRNFLYKIIQSLKSAFWKG